MQRPQKKVHITKLAEQRQKEANKPQQRPRTRVPVRRYIRRPKSKKSYGLIIGIIAFIVAATAFGTSGSEESPLAGWGSEPLPNANFNGFSPVQQRNASIIVQVGQEMQLKRRAWEIAVATSMQETRLRNLANTNPKYPEVVRISTSLPYEDTGSDHDSVGLFQQRPKEGDGNWGTVRELMNKRTAASKFYGKLVGVKNWDTIPLYLAADTVQNSCCPEAYAKHEDPAKALIDHVMKYAPAKD